MEAHRLDSSLERDRQRDTFFHSASARNGSSQISELVSKLKEKSELREREEDLNLGHFEDTEDHLMEIMSSSSENGSRSSFKQDSPKHQHISPKIQIMLEMANSDEEEGELNKRDEKALHETPFNDEELEFQSLPIKKTSD